MWEAEFFIAVDVVVDVSWVQHRSNPLFVALERCLVFIVLPPVHVDPLREWMDWLRAGDFGSFCVVEKVSNHLPERGESLVHRVCGLYLW